jgi:hypothetical protein
MSIEKSNDVIGNGTRDLPVAAQCLNQVRRQVLLPAQQNVKLILCCFHIQSMSLSVTGLHTVERFDEMNNEPVKMWKEATDACFEVLS